MTITIPQAHRIHRPSRIQAVAMAILAVVAFAGVRHIVVDDGPPATNDSAQFSIAATAQLSAIEEVQLIEGLVAGAAGGTPVQLSGIEEVQLIEGLVAGAAGGTPVQLSAIEEVQLVRSMAAGHVSSGAMTPGTWVGRVR